MRSIESEGDTIDEAIASALRALQVERDRVEVEIVADATRGLFGFGGKRARVRATVRPPISAQVREEGDGGPRDVPRETASQPAPTERQALSRARPRPVAAPAPPAPESADLESQCRSLSSELLTLIGVSCEVRVRGGSESGEVVIEVTGDSGGLLIGRRGQTLDALEYIINRMVARGDGTPAARIVLDVEGYRERRRQYLEALARRLADKARETGRVVTLNPMSPRDRRIVHLTLQEDETVTTRSQGEGHYRRMLVLPAERAQRPARPAGPAR